MQRPPATVLHVCVDEDLSDVFNAVFDSADGGAPPPPAASAALPSLSAHRSVHPASQTVMLFAQSAGGGGPSLASRWARSVDLFLLLDDSQVPAFLCKAAESAVDEAGETALASYLNAVCEATAAVALPLLLPTPSAEWSSRVVGQGHQHSHLSVHVIIAPGVLCGGGPQGSSLSAGQAAAVLAAVTAASTAWGPVVAAKGKADDGGDHWASTVSRSLASSAVLTSPLHAANAVSAVAHKRLRVMSEEAKEAMKRLHHPTALSTKWEEDQASDAVEDLDVDAFGLDQLERGGGIVPASPPPEVREEESLGAPPTSPLVAAATASPTALSSTALWVRDVRPDSSRKCEPFDFAKLYAHVLREVSSFSERKVLAAMAAFPTMHSLLSYLHEEVVLQQGRTAPSSPSSSPSVLPRHGAVYSAGFGESRQWNVLNDALVSALMEDYRGEAAA